MVKKETRRSAEAEAATDEDATGPVAQVTYVEGPSAEDAKKKAEKADTFTPKGDIEITTTGGAPRYTLYGKTIKNTPARFSPKEFSPDQWAAMRSNPSITLSKAKASDIE